MPSLYYAACCQTDFPCPADRSAIAERVDRMCRMAEYAVTGYAPFFEVRLVVFPEFAHAAPIYDSVERLRDRLAVPVPNEHTDRYAAVAKKHGCYIQTGSFLEADPDYPDVVFNTTCLVGLQGVLSKYRKVNPWIPWELSASPHDTGDAASLTHASDAAGVAGQAGSLTYGADPFPVVDTEIGRLGVAICYDWLFPETIRQIAFNGAEVIVRISAYMDPWGATPPMDWWTLFNRARAAENTVYVVATNQGARLENYPPFSWPGGSMIVDFDGRILAQADPGPGEKIVVAPIDVSSLRAERARRTGHDMRAHLRSEIHTYLREPRLAPAAPGEHPLTIETIRRRVEQAKDRLEDHR